MFAERLNLYLNFVARVLVPDNTADGFYQAHENAIRSMAGHLREKLGYPELEVYRGLLLDPRIVKEGLLAPHPSIQYISCSESELVAKRFADPFDPLAFAFRAQKAPFRGYLATLRPKPEDVLFTWRWAEPLQLQSLQIPHYNHEVVLTQREVVLRQTNAPLRVKRVA